MARALPAAFLLAFFLAGCGGLSPPGEPPLARWAPPTAPRAVIVALHGFGDHKGAFREFGAFAAARGVLVDAYDQPGFGERPDRGRWPGTDAFAAELRAVVAAARARHPGVPVHVLGESMGAAVAVAALARPGAPEVDGLILAAPAAWANDRLPRGYRVALRLLAGVAPALRVHGGHLGLLASDNVEMLRALGKDPLYLREARLDAVAGLVELMDEARAGARRLTVPTLVLLGARDEIVPPEAARALAGSLAARPCSVIAYVRGWHLLLRDHQRERVFRDILAWVAGEPPPSRLDFPCERLAVAQLPHPGPQTLRSAAGG